MSGLKLQMNDPVNGNTLTVEAADRMGSVQFTLTTPEGSEAKFTLPEETKRTLAQALEII